MTDAEFVTWARREAPGRRVLVETDFAYESGGVMREGTVYTADGEYATRHDDAPPSTIYRACVSKIADIEHAIDTATLSGQADVSVGNIEFDNHGGELDFMLRLIVDGRASRVYVGDVTWPRRDFRSQRKKYSKTPYGTLQGRWSRRATLQGQRIPRHGHRQAIG